MMNMIPVHLLFIRQAYVDCRFLFKALTHFASESLRFFTQSFLIIRQIYAQERE